MTLIILLLKVLMFLILMLIFFQDIKYRAISWVLLPGLFILIGIIGAFKVDLVILGWYMVINCMFIGFQVLMIAIYLSIKKNKLINLFNGYFGMGDLLFWITLSVLFSPLNFFVFHFFSLLFSIFLFYLIGFFSVSQKRSLPLAGLQSVFLLLIFLLNEVTLKFDFLDDYHLLKLISFGN
jgi:hypothetical protein